MTYWILLFCMTAMESLSRFWQMKQAAFLSGVDAYYYALQIKFFTQTGALKISDTSPLLHLMGWTAKLGFSHELTIILWAIVIQISCAISVFIAYRLIQRENDHKIILPLLFSWVILSPTIAFTCIEFPKYAFSFIFLPFWPVGLVHKRLWPVSLIAVILSCISHLTIIGLLFLILCGLPLIGLFRIHFNLLKRPLMVVGIISCVILGGLILGKYFLFADLKRIQFQGLQPSLWTFLSRQELPLLLKAEVLFSMLTSIIILIMAFKDKTKKNFLIWSPFIVFLLLIPLGSQEVMGIPERLCLLLPYITVCSLLFTGFQKESSVFIQVLTYSMMGIVFVSTVIFPKVYFDLVHPGRLNPNYQLYDQVTQAIAHQDIPMLIAHQGLNYYYKYKTMKESFPYEPESHWPKQKIWRVVYGITPSQWAYYLPEKYLWGSGLLFSLPENYSLIREDCWNEFRGKVKACSDDGLKDLVFDSWLNPSQPRPEFARKRTEEGDNGDFSAYPTN